MLTNYQRKAINVWFSIGLTQFSLKPAEFAPDQTCANKTTTYPSRDVNAGSLRSLVGFFPINGSKQ